MILRRLIPLMMFLPAVAPAISREMQELMRDVALLQPHGNAVEGRASLPADLTK